MSASLPTIMKYHSAIAAIFKNENRYLQEWIEFHHLVGFEHFFLYDNDGGEEAQAILAPYINQGLVTLHPWTHLDGTRHDRTTRFGGRDKNHMAFGHAATHHRAECQWLMKMDLDEFLMPLEGESVTRLIDQHGSDRVRGMQIPRINFGDGGHRSRPNKLVIESYTRRENAISDHKDLAHTAFLTNNDYKNSAHSWGYQWFSRGKLLKRNQILDMRVNHYYTKSLEECLERQNMMVTRPQTEAEFIKQNEHLNEVEDTSILRFVPELKKRIAKRST